MPAFSPLALTQVLPFLPLAQGDISTVSCSSRRPP